MAVNSAAFHEIAEAVTTPKVKSQEAESTAAAWVKSDPDAGAWAIGLRAGRPRDRTVLSAAKQWASSDPEAAAQWLRQHG